MFRVWGLGLEFCFLGFGFGGLGFPLEGLCKGALFLSGLGFRVWGICGRHARLFCHFASFELVLPFIHGLWIWFVGGDSWRADFFKIVEKTAIQTPE